MMPPGLQEGKYYYSPHRNKWGVWKVGKKTPKGTLMNDFIMDFSTKQDAKRFVYKMNGYTLKDQQDNEETE